MLRAWHERRCVKLEKNELKPWKNKAWCIPELSGEFVARMEDVLDLYEEEYDAERPVVCFDETSKQLVGHTRAAIGAQAGRVRRYDYEYKRTEHATCSCSASRRVDGDTWRLPSDACGGLCRADEMAGE